MRTLAHRRHLTPIVLAAVAIISCAPVVAGAAPVVGPSGNAYEWISEIHSWEEAASLAAAMFWTDPGGIVHQGYLATITTQAENDFIVAHVLPANAGGWGWLGGRLSTGWATEESFDFKNWCVTPHEPSGDGDCIDIMTINVASTNIGKWNDERCELALPFIVEYGPLLATPEETISFGTVRAKYR